MSKLTKFATKSAGTQNELRSKVRKYATTEFSYKKTIDDWHESALKLIDTWRDNRKNWEIRSF